MRLGGLLLALSLGGVGGGAFHLLDLPLPWMLGAMTANAAASLSGAGPSVPKGLRGAMMLILGVMLGSSFTPELVARLPHWWQSLAVLLLVMVITTVLAMTYLRRVAGLDSVTAYFSAAPGGINEMVLTGARAGGDERTIAQIHALRIVLIVFAIPFGFRLLTGVHGESMGRAMGTLADLAVQDAGWLTGAALLGLGLGHLARFPAPALTGPMAVSAALHLAGLSRAHPPAELVILAQLVTGSALGSRFVGLTLGQVWATARLSAGSTLIMIVMAGAAAVLLSVMGGPGFALLLLAFVPGGIAEMCLIALAMGQDVAFVSAHHVIRVILVIFAAPLLFGWLKGRAGHEDL